MITSLSVNKSCTTALVAIIVIFLGAGYSPNAKAEDAKRAGQDSTEQPVEISIPQYIVGGVLGTTVGFGIGHGVQGRYAKKGWVFTMLEGIALGVSIAGAANCPGDGDADDNRGNDDDIFDDLAFTRMQRRENILASSSCPGAPAILIGIGSLIGFHIWETVDVWSKPKFDIDRKKFYAEDQNRLRIGIAPLQIGGKSGSPVPALFVALTH